MDGGLHSMELENESDSEFTLAELREIVMMLDQVAKHLCGDKLLSIFQIVEMENLYKEMGEKSLNQQFCEELATKFSSSVHRRGKSSIKWQQVHSWLQDTQQEVELKISSLHQQPAEIAAKNAVGSSSSLRRFSIPLPRRVQKPAAERPRKPIGERIAELSELVFEAKSAKDFAWYDVASFINYRITSSAELEVRVRFAGFGKDEDEWVNVRRGVRQRSIPLEPSECDRIKVGDLVLCFREKVQLNRLCSRPT